MPELLVVVTIIGLAVTMAIPLITDAVRSTRIRIAADQLAVSLRAARMISVTVQADVDVRIEATPDNYYEYVDAGGRLRHFELPAGVQIMAPDRTITFQPNGAIAAPTTLTLEAPLSRGVTAEWRLDTNLLGVTSVTIVRP